MAYTIGSAFTESTFWVLPAFFHFDNDIDNSNNNANHRPVTLWRRLSRCGYGIILMTLLDFARLYLDVPLSSWACGVIRHLLVLYPGNEY
jgi:hypothetical protein